MSSTKSRVGYFKIYKLPLGSGNTLIWTLFGFTKTRRQNVSIWVVVDGILSFYLFKSTNLVEKYAKIYINEIVSAHGIPLSIILDRGSQFTSRFGRSFQKGLGTK